MSSHTQPLGPSLRINDLSTMNFSHVSKTFQLFNHIFVKSLISIKVITLNSHSIKSCTHLKRSEVIRKKRVKYEWSEEGKSGQWGWPICPKNLCKPSEITKWGQGEDAQWHNIQTLYIRSLQLLLWELIISSYILCFLFLFFLFLCGKGKQYLFVS